MTHSNFPIIDLHCHFEGSIQPEKSYEILHRHGHAIAQNYQEFLPQVIGFNPEKNAFFDAISILDMCLLDGQSVQDVTDDLIRRAAA